MTATAVKSNFVPLKDTPLFKPLQLGKLSLSHRIVQAPNTRLRNEFESRGVYVPGPRVAQYYGDRASHGGLQITEATDICLNASAYPGVAGLFTDTQLQGWRNVTNAVHAKGGFVFSQIWHTGRATSTKMRGGEQTVSSTTTPMSGNYFDGTECASDPPRALTVEDIKALTAAFATAAKRAVEEGGFDGVEIHGANGYLLEQFLHDNINTRTDAYGGSVKNRSRFLIEVIKAVSAAIGAERVGVRLSPYNYFQDTKDSDPNAHWAEICEYITALDETERPVYVHMVEPRFDEVLDEQEKLAALATYTASEVTTDKKVNSLDPFRKILQKGDIAFLACGNFNRDNAVPKLVGGGADAIVFGRHFISNPDLVARLANGWPISPYDRSTFYGANPPEKGYNDYAFYKAE